MMPVKPKKGGLFGGLLGNAEKALKGRGKQIDKAVDPKPKKKK